MGSFYKQQLNDWKATLEVKANLVYDIGGAQDPIKGMTKSWDVKNYKIIDLPVPHVEKVHPDIEHDMNNHIDSSIPKSDLIFCLGVSDYIINPNIFMSNIRRLLVVGGVAWVEFPFIYPIHNPVDEEGCRYSEGCIRRLAKQANLIIDKIIYKRPKPDNPFLLHFYSTDGMRSASGVDHNVTGYIVKFRRDSGSS